MCVHQEGRPSGDDQPQPGMVFGSRNFPTRGGLEFYFLAAIGFGIEPLGKTANRFPIVLARRPAEQGAAFARMRIVFSGDDLKVICKPERASTTRCDCPVEHLLEVFVAVLANPMITISRRVSFGEVSTLDCKFSPAELAVVVIPSLSIGSVSGPMKLNPF